MNTEPKPYLMDDRPAWDLIQKRNEEFLKELEAKFGPPPVVPTDAPQQNGAPPQNGKNRCPPIPKKTAKSA